MENFKSVANQTFDFDGHDVTVLMGHNGKGKSSVLQALRYLLNGSLPNDPIRHGCDHLYVCGTISDGTEEHLIERYSYLPASFMANGTETSEKTFLEEVGRMKAQYDNNFAVDAESNKAFFGADAGTVYSFLETGTCSAKIYGAKELTVSFPDGTVLYRMAGKPSKCLLDGSAVSSKALKEFLDGRLKNNSGVLDVLTSSELLEAMDSNDISEYLLSILPVNMGFDALSKKAQLTKEEEAVLKPLFPPDPAPISVDDINGVYKEVYRRRTDVNREMSLWEKKAGYDGDVPSLSGRECQDRLDEANKLLGAAEQLEASWKSYEALVKERNSRMEEYAGLAAEFNAMSNVTKPDESKLANLAAQEQILREQYDSESRSNAALRQANEPLRKMLSNLDAAVCPLCDKLQCTTDKHAVKNDLLRSIEKNDMAANVSDARLSSLKEQIDAVVSAENAEKDNMNMYRKKEDLYTRINDLKASIPAEPEKPKDMPDTVKLQNDAKKYADMLQSIHAYEEARKAEEQYKKLHDRHLLFDSLVKKTDPKKGILANTIISVLVMPFNTGINAFIQSVSKDMEASLRMADDGSGLQIFCRTSANSGFIPLNAASSGERMIVLLALMDLISDLSNAKIICFDDLEQLDAANFDALLSYLVKNGSKYDNVLISAVDHDDVVDAVNKYKGTININLL